MTRALQSASFAVGTVPVSVQLNTEIQYSVSVSANTELGSQYSVPSIHLRYSGSPQELFFGSSNKYIFSKVPVDYANTIFSNEN